LPFAGLFNERLSQKPPSTSAHFDLCLFTHGPRIIKLAQFASVRTHSVEMEDDKIAGSLREYN
jgi:hypothetical protein